MEIEHDIYLSLGSNCGDREENLSKAISKINEQIGKVIKQATLFENKAQGFESQDLFLNTCIQIHSSIDYLTLLEKIKQLERELGRKPKTTTGYESREIDIDILFYDDLIYFSPELIIPHKLFRNRDFVLIPLSEIAPYKIDPVTLLTSSQLLELIKN